MNPHGAVEMYLSAQQVRGLSRRTVDRRRWSLGQFVHHLGDVELEHVHVDDVERFLARYPHPQTRQSIRSDVNQLYHFAIRRGLLEHNPCDLIDAPRIGSRAASPVPVRDVLRALAAASDPVRLMIMLAAYAGLRVSEIAALRADHIDVAAGVIVVHHGKGDQDETVPLADELAAELATWPRTGRLFPGMAGNLVSARIRRVFRSLEINKRPHDLRHSFGTQSARRTGGNLLVTSQLMRHKNVATTQRYVKYHAPGAEIVTGLYSAA